MVNIVSCYGQVFPPQKLEQFNFSSIEKKVSENEKLNLLKKLVFSEYLLPEVLLGWYWRQLF